MNLTKRGIRTAIYAALALIALAAASAHAQMRAVDPDAAIDADLSGRAAPAPPVTNAVTAATVPAPAPAVAPAPGIESISAADSWDRAEIGNAETYSTTASSSTYRKDDLIGAAEGVFGKGAQGLAGIIEDILRKQGEPNGYITGREASGAVAVGLRYGSGTLHHKVEGNMPVYWTGPSIGFDLGANVANAYVLVYNLNDTKELYKRFPAGEGQAYLVGGFHVSYLRKGDVVLIPVRMGAGLRLGANLGYMRFSKKQRWAPF
ncbi:MAG: DUF1134 domain-containing protein [Alphaproteobacteria bacterium]|nr:DUF1134 domain-containing protein [Alphaproteobacteria bacterium]